MNTESGCTTPILSYCIHNRLVDIHGRVDQTVMGNLSSLIVKNNLRIVVAVLSHVGSGRERLRVTTQLFSSLSKFFTVLPNIELLWSVQGGSPEGWSNFAPPEGVCTIIHETKSLGTANGVRLACDFGKAEHLLMLVRYLIDAGYPTLDTFLVTLDDDYAVYDAINVLGLFAPWVLSRSSSSSGPLVGFTKGGGARVVPPSSLLAAIANGGRQQLTYGELCREVAWRCNKEDSPFLERDIVTPEYLASLDVQVTRFVREGLRDFCRSGGRNSRALSVYLASKGNDGVAAKLSRFSFLLHGDQGATLHNWASIQLGKGFALELTFLAAALTGQHQCQAACNVITLPHAHFPRDGVASFELGVEMFRILRSICDDVPGSISDKQPPIGTGDVPTFYVLQDFFVTQEVRAPKSDLSAAEFLPRAESLHH